MSHMNETQNITHTHTQIAHIARSRNARKFHENTKKKNRKTINKYAVNDILYFVVHLILFIHFISHVCSVVRSFCCLVRTCRLSFYIYVHCTCMWCRVLFISFIFPVSSLNNLNDLHCCFNKLFVATLCCVVHCDMFAMCHAVVSVCKCGKVKECTHNKWKSHTHPCNATGKIVHRLGLQIKTAREMKKISENEKWPFAWTNNGLRL